MPLFPRSLHGMVVANYLSAGMERETCSRIDQRKTRDPEKEVLTGRGAFAFISGSGIRRMEYA
jgi:hypothetical protein